MEFCTPPTLLLTAQLCCAAVLLLCCCAVAVLLYVSSEESYSQHGPECWQKKRLAMESNELEAEGEALRRTLERIEFLLKQGFISEEDAACRKQGAIDNFCLAPMIDRRQRLQTEANRATFGAGRDNAGLPSGGNTSSSPAAASAGDAVISAVDSEHPTSSLSSSSSSTSEATGDVLGGSGHVLSGRASPSSTVSSSNPGAKQSRKRRLTEVSGQYSSQSRGEGSVTTSGGIMTKHTSFIFGVCLRKNRLWF